VRDEIIEIAEGEEGLAAELDERIYAFNVEATGIDDGRLLSAAIRDDRGDLIAGLTGWTWGACGYVDVLWVREDHRNQELGTRLLDAAEDEARNRGCVQMVLATHTFQALDLYRRRGYVEYGRVENYPEGHAWVHLVKDLTP
jgi:ribosomal protein S18 acetylase RimI-like enzyme